MNMLTKKDLIVVNHLRKNSRIKITELSKKMEMPVTTLYSKIHNFERNLIKKHTSLIHFPLLGYNKICYFIIKSTPMKIQLREFLQQQNCINSLFQINFGYDFLLEGYFRHEKEAQEFLDKIKHDYSADVQMISVIEEIKREEFTPDPDNCLLLGERNGFGIFPRP